MVQLLDGRGRGCIELLEECSLVTNSYSFGERERGRGSKEYS